MTDIDQAFISAYENNDSPRGGESILPMPSAPYATGQAHLQVVTDRPERSSIQQSSKDSIAAPHFTLPKAFDAYGDASSKPEGLPNILEKNQRRPLSEFSAAEQPSEESFRPLFEVDSFRMPEICTDLIAQHRNAFTPVIEQLLASREEGRTMIGLFGIAPKAGCTTMQLCLARLLAEAGLSVAVVDANYSNPQLAALLGLAVESGWEDVLLGEKPLAECVVHSIEDRFTLLPLTGREVAANELFTSIHASVSAGMLRYQYDLVLLDLGAAGQSNQVAAQAAAQQCRLDACLALTDGTTSPAENWLAGAVSIATELETTCLGVVENFWSPISPS